MSFVVKARRRSRPKNLIVLRRREKDLTEQKQVAECAMYLSFVGKARRPSRPKKLIVLRRREKDLTEQKQVMVCPLYGGCG